ncbi:hypothetical protein [Undibacterium oligocarboniphilum]|uniref:Uncharacterized protein n=1 Tax=Undibacterium oligocarboniphilum TaxID=666702 RepID=A0A850QNW8_9BURK|nr:hypothetical protein [Undibacterium oligocarboniphilum]MBC3871729.1 hypothetical protein [Undibacterium oligocarboniphilum]NVO79365.1 hypothetical protein [Undibacterium oligocarboniphilum]
MSTNANAASIINVHSLPGVLHVEDASNEYPRMKIVFADGVEATVARSPINKALFDIWLPPDSPFMAASVMPSIDETRVMTELTKLAAKATVSE